MEADERQLVRRKASQHAIGDNYDFEERVGAARLAGFERDAAGKDLLIAHDRHVKTRVQGARREHVPVTFTLDNKTALWLSDVEPNQKIVRLECIDYQLSKILRTDPFEAVEQAIRSPRDEVLIQHFLDTWLDFPGARPAFVAFKSEVDDELRRPDWLLRLRNRLGLGHYDPKPGQRMSFALMEYRAEDVLAEFAPARAGGAERAFAMPTVLDSRPSAFFFPSPSELPSGFAADLGETPGPMIRELLHVRLTYRPHHLVRVGQLVGPLPPVPLATVRDRHLDTVRNHSSRPGFGNHMTGEVDD